jgi:tRNA threonylcarbamoyladenosine biosynthesis protein TsaE
MVLVETERADTERAVRRASASAAETMRIGEAVGKVLAPGDLLLLRGEIGAGKTTFVKGVAAGLGIEEPVVSPTFLLHLIYEGRLTLNHFDFYRLDDPSEALIFGLDETLDSGGVALVEWADRIPTALRPPYLDIELEPGHGADDRLLAFRPAGGSWAERLAALPELRG